MSFLSAFPILSTSSLALGPKLPSNALSSLFTFLSLSLFSPAAAFPIPAHNSVQSLFERARLRGSKEDKDIINGEEIKTELQPSTKSGYRHALALWQQ